MLCVCLSAGPARHSSPPLRPSQCRQASTAEDDIVSLAALHALELRGRRHRQFCGGADGRLILIGSFLGSLIRARRSRSIPFFCRLPPDSLKPRASAMCAASAAPMTPPPRDHLPSLHTAMQERACQKRAFQTLKRFLSLRAHTRRGKNTVRSSGGGSAPDMATRHRGGEDLFHVITIREALDCARVRLVNVASASQGPTGDDEGLPGYGINTARLGAGRVVVAEPPALPKGRLGVAQRSHLQRRALVPEKRDGVCVGLIYQAAG